jgi:hypothetical protein
MPFMQDILRHKSVSIIGLDKNTGKTECLNYILRQLKITGKNAAVTSIGLDGESADLVTNTPKPELGFYDGLIFATSEKHYRQKKITAEILDVSERKTALGRLVTARCKSEGKCVISGPSDTNWLKSFIDSMERFQVDITIIDGAISRKSLASPAVTDCLMLATGAAVSANLQQLVKKTKFAVDLIQIPQYSEKLSAEVHDKESGLWVVNENGELQQVLEESSLHLNTDSNDFFRFGNTLVFTGMITDRTLDHLESLLHTQVVRIVVKDFTRIFVSPEKFLRFKGKGGQIFVLNRSLLIAVCVNPYSPTGYHLESDEMVNALENVLTVPVYDVKKLSI